MVDELDDYKEARYLARVVEDNQGIRGIAWRCLEAIRAGEIAVTVTPDEYHALAPVLWDRSDLWDQILIEICEQEGWEVPWGSSLEVRVMLPIQSEMVTISVVKV